MSHFLIRNRPRRLLSSVPDAWQAQAAVETDQDAMLSLLLRLELLSAALYAQGITGSVGTLATPAVLSVLQQISKHEQAHVQTVAQLLGVSNPTSPSVDLTAGGIFPNVLSDSTNFFKVAQLIEDMSVRMYLAAILADTAGSAAIVTIAAAELTEARHAAQIRNIRNGGFSRVVTGFGAGLAPWIPYAAAGATQSLFDSGYQGSAMTAGTQAYVAAIVYGPATGTTNGTQPPSSGEDNLVQLGTLLPSPAGAEAFDEPMTSSAVSTFLTFFNV